MQSHGQVMRGAVDLGRAAGIAAEDRILLAASLWGAQALGTSWTTFLHGAALMSFPVVENGITGLPRALSLRNSTRGASRSFQRC